MPLQVEDSVDLGLCGSKRNQGTVCPITQGQAKRAKQDRLAGACFARNDAHPFAELQFELVNQGQ